MGKLVKLHQIAGFVNKALQKTENMETAIDGFRNNGLWPFDKHVFYEKFSIQEKSRALDEVHLQKLTSS